MKSFTKLLLLLAFLGGCSGFLAFDCGGACDPTKQAGQIGVCPNPNIPKGEPGGACINAIGQHCTGSATCRQQTCFHCGLQGELCCDTVGLAPLPPQCAGGSCQGGSGKNSTCDDNCGQLGQPCCPNGAGCPHAGATCNASTQHCVASANASNCNGGPAPVVVWFEDASKCIQMDPLQFYPTSQAAEQACIQEMLPAGFSVAPDAGGTYWFCVKPNLTINAPSRNSVQAENAADAQTCIESAFSTSDYTLTPIPDPSDPNACPGAPL